MQLKKRLAYSYLPTSDSFYPKHPTKPPLHPSFKKKSVRPVETNSAYTEDNELFLTHTLHLFYANFNDDDIQEKIALLKENMTPDVTQIKEELQDTIAQFFENTMYHIFSINPSLLNPFITIVSKQFSIPDVNRNQYLGYLTISDLESTTPHLFKLKLDMIIDALSISTTTGLIK